jgi:hypothetical protein
MKTLYQATALFLLALCFCQPALAQTPDTAKVYRHQIGILASPLYENDEFRSKMPVALGLIYRANYKENKAIRVAVAAAYERNTYVTTLEEHPFPKDTIDEITYIELNIGHEWTYPVTQRVSLGYGTDMAIFYNYSSVKTNNILLDDNIGAYKEKVLRENTTKGLSIQPFINANIKIGERISLIAESKINLSYNSLIHNTNGSWVRMEEEPIRGGEIKGTDKQSTFNSNFKPLSSIQLNFNF